MNTVEHLVGRVVGPDDADEDHGATRKCDVLPGFTGLFGTIPNRFPVGFVVTDLDVIGISTIVAIP